MTDVSKIDRDALRRLYRALGEDIEDFHDIFRSFESDTPPLFVSMRSSIANHDWETLRRTAHTAKGAARDFGVLKMAEVCSQLEHNVTEQMIAELNQNIDVIEQVFWEAVTELKILLKTRKL